MDRRLWETHNHTEEEVQEGKWQEYWVTGTGKLKLRGRFPPKMYISTESLQNCTDWGSGALGKILNSAHRFCHPVRSYRSEIPPLLFGFKTSAVLPALQTGSLRNAVGFPKRRIIPETTLVICLSRKQVRAKWR